MSEKSRTFVVEIMALVCVVLAASLFVDILVMDEFGLDAETAGVGTAGAALLAAIAMLAAYVRQDGRDD